MTVAVKAPASVRWETERGAKLGAGSTSLALAAGQTRIVAHDGARGGRVVVDVTPGATVDWEALPRGRLDVRVEPYADVLLGAETVRHQFSATWGIAEKATSEILGSM
jgi:hypothetical protein